MGMSPATGIGKWGRLGTEAGVSVTMARFGESDGSGLFEALESEGEIGGRADGLSVEGLNEVAFFQPGLLGRGTFGDVGDESLSDFMEVEF